MNKQLVITVMFEARIAQMANELSKATVGELDSEVLLKLHHETCRLLRMDLPEGETQG